MEGFQAVFLIRAGFQSQFYPETKDYAKECAVLAISACCANCPGRRQSMIGRKQSRDRSLRGRIDRKRRHDCD